MDKRLQEILVDKYPDLCQQANLTIHQSTMAWGFEVRNGWFKLLDSLLEELSKFEGLQLTQVKEKFGSLTVYIAGGNDEAHAIIDDYELKSMTICETCGSPGKRRGRGWIYTACEDCHRKYSEGKCPWMEGWDE